MLPLDDIMRKIWVTDTLNRQGQCVVAVATNTCQRVKEITSGRMN